MIRRDFIKAAMVSGVVSGARPSLGVASGAVPKKRGKAAYRGGIVGLGWMGMLYDMGRRDYENIEGSYKTPKYDLDSPNRSTPDWLDVYRKFYYHDHPGKEGLVATYAEVMWNRPEVELVAGCDRDKKRLAMLGQRYGIKNLYTDALEMYEKENLDILALATNTKGRSFLTVKAVEAGVKGIFVDKPMTFTLREADDMVRACADAGVPLVGRATTVSHPSFGKAKELIHSGTIGDVRSIEAKVPIFSQHQGWSYFVDSDLAWVSGIGDKSRRKRGSTEFMGQGIIVFKEGPVVHIRDGAPMVRISGSQGEMLFEGKRWRLWQDSDTAGGKGRVEMLWPEPQFGTMRTVWCLDDLIACMEGRMDEPKNSGRRVATALEAEVALKQSSAQGGKQVVLPLKDRSLGLTYDWFR